MTDQSKFPCCSCDRPMVSQKTYAEDPARWRAQGFVRHGAGDCCNGCYVRCRRRGDVVPGMATGRRRRAPGSGPLSSAEVARLRALVGVA